MNEQDMCGLTRLRKGTENGCQNSQIWRQIKEFAGD